MRFPVFGVVLTFLWGRCILVGGGFALGPFIAPLLSESEVSESESDDVEIESVVGGGERLEGITTDGRDFTCSSSGAGKVMHKSSRLKKSLGREESEWCFVPQPKYLCQGASVVLLFMV